MLNLTPFLTPEWSTDAFVKLFGYPWYFLSQCGIFVPTSLFLHVAFNTLLSLYRSFTVNKSHKKTNFSPFCFWLYFLWN